MTPADLDALAALHGQMTPGPWEAVRKSVRVAGSSNAPYGAPRGNDGTGICNTLGAGYGSGKSDPVNRRAETNAAGIVALVNAAPDLLRLARKGMEAANE